MQLLFWPPIWVSQMSNSDASTCVLFKAAEGDGPTISPRDEALWLLKHFFGESAGEMQKRLLEIAEQARAREGMDAECMITETHNR